MGRFNKFYLALAIGQLMLLSNANAANLSVDTTADVDADDGFCTLREAITSIHSEQTLATGCDKDKIGEFGVNDTILFYSSLDGQTIGLSQASALTIAVDIVINEPTNAVLTIDGMGNAGVFAINNAAVELNHLTITGGNTPLDGGGVLVTGHDATVSLNNSTVTDNVAGEDGGGISASISSTVILTDSIVSENTATQFGGGIFSGGSNITLSNSDVLNNLADDDGGGINSTAPSIINLTNSNVSGNETLQRGGGISATGPDSTVNLTNTTVTNNSAIRHGGGIHARTSSTVNLTANSTVSGNMAGLIGGGIHALNSAKINMTNSTLSENSELPPVAPNLTGGGLSIHNLSEAMLINSTVSGNSAHDAGGFFVNQSTATLINSTVSGNTTTDDGGGIGVVGSNALGQNSTITIINSTISENDTVNYGGGLFVNDYSNISLINSIVLGNLAGIDGAEIRIHAATGTVTADNANLLGEGTQTNAHAFSGFIPSPPDPHFFPGPADIDVSSDSSQPIELLAILGPLADNGGLTETHALVADSPAIDMGNQAQCQSNNITTDQRGLYRIDGTCDIGSFELGASADSGSDDTSCYVIKTSAGKVVTFCL